MTAPLLVLIVDDVADQRELLRTHLERAGCSVRSCADVGEVDRALDDDRVDAAIVDLLMPDVDGWGVIDRIRARSPLTTVIVASVLDEVDYPEGVRPLPKPFTGSQVRRLVAELRRARDERAC